MATSSEIARGRPDSGVGHYLRDIVYGASDGVVTTLAVVAGAAGADFDPRVGLVLGLANIAADGLSMGASNYLGMKSELEQVGIPVGKEMPWRHGVVTAAAFMAAGAVPLLSYAATSISRELRFVLALVLSFLVLALVGGARSLFVRASAVRCAAEMVLVAGSASGASYLLGLLVAPLVR